ncbi:MAG: hypothetical protein QOF76_1231 [Solirubrobacteraceae bacterium]|jgi:hypothetical protein|nr:hypothetical protein [Solirubrobacteraceae bacterium]
MTRNTRIGFLVAALVVVVVAIIVIGSGGDDKTKTSTGTQHLAVKDGKPVGGIKTIEVKKGATVSYVVTVDKAVEIHTHGYDIAKDAAPGKPARFSFKADNDGIFEIEVEDTGTQIAKLRVDP